MSKHDNGGPAFPIPLQSGQRWQGMAPCDRMTMRDYFAAKAPVDSLRFADHHAAAQFAGVEVPTTDVGLIQVAMQAAAKAAYIYADAMLKARDAQ